MTKETYVRAIVRNLRLPHKTKRRIKNDLLNDFIVRIEAGESQEQIIAEDVYKRQSLTNMVVNHMAH